MSRKIPSQEAFDAMRKVMSGYYPIADATWKSLMDPCAVKELAKDQVIYSSGSVPTSFAFLHSGLIKGFIGDEEGNEYNKIFFDEGTFPGSMAALLTAQPSRFTFEALEPSWVIKIPFAA